jgi:uncharacterized protein involved in outer membrane biogenesis
MTASRRNKLLIGVGALVALVIVALLVAPRLIDVNSYKPALIAAVKQATGRELVIDGPISLTLLPTPEVTTTGVRFANAAGARGAQMLDVKSVSVSPSLWALLTGRIEVGSLTLVEPKIYLEPGSDGRPNWQFRPEGAANQAPGAPSEGFNVSIGRLAIENGTLSFYDPKNGVAITAEKINVVASVGSEEGPFAAAGSAVLNGTPLKIDAKVGARESAGHNADITLETGGGKLVFDGTLSDLSPNTRLLGNVSMHADSLTGFLAALLTAAGQEAPPWPPLLAGKFSFDGVIEKSPNTLAARDYRIALGEDSGAGNMSLTLAPSIVLDARLVMPKIDIDKWMAELAKPAAAAVNTPASTAAPKPGAVATAAFAIPANVTVTASMAVAEVLYNKASVQNVSLQLEIRDGVVAVPRLSALLPGDMTLQANSTISGDATRPQVNGEFSLVGPKLRETLGWLKVDLAGVPPDKLTKFSLRGKMASNGPTNVQVNDAVFELDDLKGTAGVVATLGAPLSIVTQLELGAFDVDAYLPAPAPGQKPETKTTPAAAAPPTSQAMAIGPSLGLKLKVAKLIYRKETFGGLDADVAVQGNVFTVNDIKVSDLLGGRAALRGSVVGFSSPAPRIEMAVNLDLPDADRALKFAGAGGVLKGKVGALTASGGIGGTMVNVALRDLTVNAVGTTAHLTGTISLTGARKFDLSHISVQTQDPARLAAVMTGEAAGGAGMGPVTLSGALAGSPERATFKGNFQARGNWIDASVDATLGNRPNITADLQAHGPLDLDKLSAGSGAPVAAARPAPGRGGQPAAAAAPPIDTAAMRSLDASIKLTAATMIMSPMRIANAELAATLKNGVITLQRFKGGLYGGTLDLTGTVNGSGPVLAFDVKGSATGLSIGDILRSTAGTNVFGDRVKASIDGRLNATGIEFRGSGATSVALKNSLSGGMALGGFVLLGVDRALLAVGSLAGGAVGAAGSVVDNTVGSVLSGVTGQRLATDLGSDANAIILLVNRFANRDNPISGRLDIASGTATTNGLTVQGNRATANISSRTNLMNSTTDTTVNFFIAEQPSTTYLTTSARGPTSSPSLSVSRGAAARDQPSSSGPSLPIPGVGRLPLPLPNLPGLFGR